MISLKGKWVQPNVFKVSEDLVSNFGFLSGYCQLRVSYLQSCWMGGYTYPLQTNTASKISSLVSPSLRISEYLTLHCTLSVVLIGLTSRTSVLVWITNLWYIIISPQCGRDLDLFRGQERDLAMWKPCCSFWTAITHKRSNLRWVGFFLWALIVSLRKLQHDDTRFEIGLLSRKKKYSYFFHFSIFLSLFCKWASSF